MGSVALWNTTGSVYPFNLNDLMKLLKRTFQSPLDRRQMRCIPTPYKAFAGIGTCAGQGLQRCKKYVCLTQTTFAPILLLTAFLSGRLGSVKVGKRERLPQFVPHFLMKTA